MIAPPEPDSRDGDRPRQLLVDVSVIAQSDAGTGIQRVVRAILAQLIAAPLRDVTVRPVAASAQVGYRYLPPSFDSGSGPALETCPVVEIRPGDVFLGLDLASAIMPRHEAQLAAWRSAGASICVFVYDLLPLLHGEWFRRRTRRHFARWLRLLERQADLVLCHADPIKRDFERWNRRWWRPRSARTVPVVAVPLCGDLAASVPSRGRPDDADQVMQWIGRRQTVLMVGTVEPRKGYDQALAAFERLWKADGSDAPQLLIVGRPGWKTRRLQARLRRRSGLGGPMLWREDVSDEFLAELYDACAGLLFASRGEGFGLPVAEAAAQNIPLLVRDLPVLRPLVTHAGRSFSGNGAGALASAIRTWLGETKPVRCQGTGPAARRTWQDVTHEVATALGLQLDGDGVCSLQAHSTDGAR